MYYRVRARFREHTAGAFRQALRDTIPKQQPDGEEIADSMRRAVVTHGRHHRMERSMLLPDSAPA